MLRFAGLLLALLTLTPARSATYRVSPSPPGPAVDGLTWATAFPTVQQALDAAESGDEVWVAAGTYQENLTLNSGVGLYGGFAGTETSREQRQPRSNATELDGQYQGTVVTIAADATSQTVVDGFIIQDGVGPITNGGGGGVFVPGGTPVISNNVIRACTTESGRTATSCGGGLYAKAGAFPLIAGNTFLNNHSMFGGGVYAMGGLIRDNYFAGNSAYHTILLYGQGGGVCCYSGTAVLHNVFEGNSAGDPGGGGGGVCCNVAVLMDNRFIDNDGFRGAAIQSAVACTVVRNTITDTTSAGYIIEAIFSGGVFSDNLIAVTNNVYGLDLGRSSEGNWGGTEPLISNNTIVHMGAGGPFGVVSNYRYGENPVFANNLITGWEAAAAYDSFAKANVFTTANNNVYGNGDNSLPLPGTQSGNISADPRFVDGANGDYRLQAGSPCIDAGSDGYVASGDRDLLGAPRIAGSHVDIGCYEYGSPAWTMLDAAEVLKVAAGLSLATPAEVSRLDVAAEDGATGPNLTVLDATRIAGWLLN